MFEDFTAIPKTEDEARNSMTAFNTILNRLIPVIPNRGQTTNWQTDYSTSAIGTLLAVLTAASLKNDHDRFVITYYTDGAYRLNQAVNNQVDENYGIFINREAGTHFIETEYTATTYLTSAEEFLKQSSHHYLRIFTTTNNKRLYVWTNKALTPVTLYHLFALYHALYPQENKMAEDFTKCLVEDKLDEAKKIITNYLESDAVKEIEFENFRKCLSNGYTTKINALINTINNRRNCINDYEQRIAQYATEIRKATEEIAFLRSTDISEEQKLFFKHLKKIPYIKDFEGNRDGFIKLSYEAPIIYFSDYPAEKLIDADYPSEFYKNILRILIGRKYELITKCTLIFYTDDFQVESGSSTGGGFSEVIPHPHIARYGCFGNHRQAISDSAEQGDYIGAIEQITQAVLNLNFYDTCVVDELIRTLESKKASLVTWRCVETGEMLTTEKVLERNDYYEEA